MSTATLLARAVKEVASARLLYEQEFHEACVSRAYYGMFYAAEAMLLYHNQTASTHKGLITLFARHLVKPGFVPARYGQMLSRASQKRQVADYADDFVILPEEAADILANAEEFVRFAEVFCTD